MPSFFALLSICFSGLLFAFVLLAPIFGFWRVPVASHERVLMFFCPYSPVLDCVRVRVFSALQDELKEMERKRAEFEGEVSSSSHAPHLQLLLA